METSKKRQGRSGRRLQVQFPPQVEEMVTALGRKWLHGLQKIRPSDVIIACIRRVHEAEFGEPGAGPGPGEEGKDGC